MLETINDFGRKVTALYEEGHYCSFAPPEETIGVIDTSPEHDGSRGIAFLCDEIRTCFAGVISRVGYKQVCSVRIVKSYETTFDDELEIEAPNCCIRITDCSLNKFFLRQLINSMCRIYYTMRDEQRQKLHENCTAAAAEHFSGEIPQVEVEIPEADPLKPAPLPPPPEPSKIPEGEIRWLSTAPEVPEPEKSAEDEKPEAQDKPAKSKEDELLSGNELPEDMTRDEAMSYLVDSINEINSDTAGGEADEKASEADEEAAKEEQPEEELSTVPQLTEEPQLDDVYIKASRRLRLCCMERLLTMEQIEQAVKENMVATAEIYSNLAAEKEIPQNIVERTEALKIATDRLAEYFALGEDIAARVMFFMLYQMLSYSDRISEQPETKERLNDFFRRYGSAAMALSLLDSGI